MTNGDKIRKMSNRQLCRFLYEISEDGTAVYVDGEWRNSYELLDWLDEEIEESDEEWHQIHKWW